jgi:monofunctional biosynthetic peptidoglycan transglycosylase
MLTTHSMYLFAHHTEQQIQDWLVINDGVMGGVSQARVEAEAGAMVFRGEVSLENHGGFASTRTIAKDFMIGDTQGIMLRVRGDGQRYQLRLRMSDRRGELSYVAAFTAPVGAWADLELPFSAFEPRFRGRVIPEAPAIYPAAIRHLGFLIAGKQAGRFRLDVQEIAAYVRE